MFVVDAKVKELVYSDKTVIFLLPNRDMYDKNNFFFWSPSQSDVKYETNNTIILN